MIRDKIDHLADFRRRNGTWAALRWVADRLANRLVNVRVSYLMWLDGEKLNQSLRPDSEFTFRFLGPEEIRAFSGDPAYELEARMADRVVVGRDFCYAALSGPRLAAYGWYALQSIEPEHNGGTALSYPCDAAYMYKTFTHPDFRGRRLQSLTAASALRALADHGVSKLLSAVDWANRASLRSCFHVGYVSLGYTVTFGIARCHVSFFPRAAKRLGIKFGKHAKPRPAPAECERFPPPTVSSCLFAQAEANGRR